MTSPESELMKNGYIHSNHLKLLFIIILTVVALLCVLITLGFGVYDISLPDAIRTFFDHLLGNVGTDRTSIRNDHYVWDVRLPRAIGALLIGAGLAVAGAIMQNDFRNPLAEPYTMGISSGAFLGAVLFIVLEISIIPISGLDSTLINACICSLIPTVIIVTTAKFKKLTPTAMILTGVAIMFLFNSICQVILVSAPSETLADAYNWRVGTLSRIEWDSLPPMIIVDVIIISALWIISPKLDVMYSGDKPAQTMGVNPQRLRIVTLIMVSIMTAVLVGHTGTIGFIGLVGPHVARIFVGSKNKYLIPASAAFGAAFIIIADTIAKVSGVNGLPVGVISSMVGGPLFIWILIKQRKKTWM